MKKETVGLGDRDGERRAVEILSNVDVVFGAPWSLDTLLWPLSMQQFSEDYWGKVPLRIARNNSEFYCDLISIHELEQYFSQGDFFRRQSVTTPSRELEEYNEPPTSVSELNERLSQGSSLRLRRMECFIHPAAPVQSMLRSMEQALQHPKDSLSCYITPAGATGLGPHHDETEIFTLQISGSKRWRIFHRVDADFPGLHDEVALGDPTYDIVLEPGDLFYLPRGYVHHVTNDESSFSLTIVFEPFKWSVILDLLVAGIARTSPFLAPLPIGMFHGGTQSDAFRRDFEDRIALVRDAISALNIDTLIDALTPLYMQRLTLPPDNCLTSIFSLDELTLETWLERRTDVVARLMKVDDHIVLILPGGYQLQASALAEKAFRQALTASRPFRVVDIHESLSRPARLAFAQRLISCGLLRVIFPQPE